MVVGNSVTKGWKRSWDGIVLATDRFRNVQTNLILFSYPPSSLPLLSI